MSEHPRLPVSAVAQTPGAPRSTAEFLALHGGREAPSPQMKLIADAAAVLAERNPGLSAGAAAATFLALAELTRPPRIPEAPNLLTPSHRIVLDGLLQDVVGAADPTVIHAIPTPIEMAEPTTVAQEEQVA